ncbi:MAG: hypothetical protein NT067_05125 [Candidatus Diapherotrites archaeon]|nr:hypothetical protein [Candidatus Diapherotrites archaeon]
MENIELIQKENKAVISVNPKIFPLEIIYSSAYVFLDKAYFVIDGDPKTKIKVIMKAKKKIGKEKLEELALEFHNEMVNYSSYAIQSAKNQAVREAIIKRALATNLGEEAAEEIAGEEEKAGGKAEKIDFSEEKDLYFDDPEGIAEPWTPEKAKGIKKPAKKQKKVC